jgi:hypothetical protein
VTRGMPILLVTHATFLVAFIAAWLTKQPDSAREAARALFDRWPQWSQRRVEGWLKSSRVPNELLLFLLLAPLLLELLGVVPWQIERSIINSLWTAPGSLEAVASGKVGVHGIQEAASR